MVLGKKEKALMNVVYKAASGSSSGQCLVSPADLLLKIPYKLDFRESDLAETLNQLTLDGYFIYEKAKKTNGDPMYIITLKDNGISYQRDKVVARRKLAFRIILTILIAGLSFSIKYILQAIFG
jgi:hypothetical protein